MEFYDGTKLLSLLDLNGNVPEIRISTSNRSAGKSTYWYRYAINRFLKGKIRKFAFLYRYNYELSDVAEKIFKDIKGLFFNDYTMSSKSFAKGIYHELYLQYQDNDCMACGYAITINSADQLKKYSHVFSDVDLIIFDEFMSENNQYAPNEINKFQSLHVSIARGQGQQSRYVPVIMISNPITLLNPYYIALGISDRIQENTRFLKGNGFVLENGFNDSASQAQTDSIFNNAFSTSTYQSYNRQGVYLNDNKAFIENMIGKSKYLATLVFENQFYSIKQYDDKGILYCDNKYDETYPLRIAITTDDHNINYLMLKNNDVFIQHCRRVFDNGCFRFKNLQCKKVVFKLFSYVV